MIILENDHGSVESQTKTIASPVSPRRREWETRTTSPRDGHDDSPAVDQAPPPYSPTSQEHEPLLTPQKSRRRARNRFATAFAIAFIIFISSGICFNVIRSVHERIPKRWPKPKSPQENPGFSEEVVQCIDMSEWTPESSMPIGSHDAPKRSPLQLATANFDLPSSAHSLFFWSDGSAIGQVFVLAEDSPLDRVHVEILRKTKRPTLPETHICVLKREEGSFGVGILASSHKSGPPDVDTGYVVGIKLPATRKRPRHYKSLDIKTSAMIVAFNDLSGSVKFEDVTIYSPDSATAAESLHADRINITNTLGGIQGVFRASELLSLSTSNDPIFISADLHGGNLDKPSQLILVNPNGTIQANVLLSPQVACDNLPDSSHNIPTSLPVIIPSPPHPTNLKTRPVSSPNPTIDGWQASPVVAAPKMTPKPSSCPPPSYSIHASANSSLTLNFHSLVANETDVVAPLLNLNAYSKSSSASVTLPATFEGRYEMKGRFVLVLDDVSKDPSGRERKRSWDLKDDKTGGDSNLNSPIYDEVSLAADVGVIEHSNPGKTDTASGSVWWGEVPGEQSLQSKVIVEASKLAYLHFAE